MDSNAHERHHKQSWVQIFPIFPSRFLPDILLEPYKDPTDILQFFQPDLCEFISKIAKTADLGR
jgi:hypothetical protein